MSEFRKMRRYRQELTAEETQAILREGTHGVLACAGDDGYPYAVPLSYVYDQGCVYFHMAQSGHKADAMARCEKVSFCVVGQDLIVPEDVTTYFRSAIAFGRARILEGDEKMTAARKLADKYASSCPEAIEKDIRDNYDNMHMMEIRIEHMTGKEAIELVRQRENGQIS